MYLAQTWRVKHLAVTPEFESFLCTAHSTSMIKYASISRGLEKIKDPRLSILASCQPYLLKNLVNRPDYNGFNDRFLYCAIDEVDITFEEQLQPIPEDVSIHLIL